MIKNIIKRVFTYLPFPARPNAGFVFGASALISTAILLIWLNLPADLFTFSKSSIIGYSIVNLCRLLLALLFPLVFIVSRYSLAEKPIFGTNPGIGAFLLSALAGFPAMLIFISIHNLTARTILVYGGSLAQPAIFFVSEDASIEAIILILIIGAALPILLQELFFRGLLRSVLPGQMTGIKGNLFVAVLFALYMLSPVDFLAFFLLGLLLGYIRNATDNVFCPMLTQIIMTVTYFLFRTLLPYLDTTSIHNHVEIDSTLLYTAITALVMASLALIPILSQLHKISIYLKMEKIDDLPKEPGPIREHISWSFWLGLLFLSSVWILILGI